MLFRSFNYSEYCEKNAWISLTVYSLSSLFSDLIQIYLVFNDSAFFLIIADALTVPLISITFSFSIFGKDAESIKWPTILALIFIVIGMLIYKFDEIKELIFKCKSNDTLVYDRI